MTNENQYFAELEVYKHFIDLATAQQITLIDKHINICMPLLDAYYKAFPTYTLHNLQHQKNILKLVGELLGDELNKLNVLETAIIILSTVYHDLGMVFNDSQLAAIEKEEDFQQFLDNNFKAKLKYQEEEFRLNRDLAEWYCRWVHAKRVWLFLKDMSSLEWGNIALNIPLGNICESHNYPASKLIDDNKFETNFIAVADFRFCAVLLRLADVLDFDNTRTPESVYEFLGLDNPKNNSEKTSKEEWQKHLCSDGFSIKHNAGIIELSFTAGPKHPQIEKGIQTFLDLIEDELKACTGVVDKCSLRWRSFKLPLIIDRSGIKSQNYKKGDYRLSLDENQIIKLLAGENLYDNDFVFIRELLQNAIDTSRMREYHELSNGNVGFKIKPIEIKSWIDTNGYRWVRVDDYGMGVNEYVVENHLLKKGSSYYNSDYFKIQKRFFKEKTTKDFTPISRFGIGLLSCFILGDAIEINTRAIPILQTKSIEEKIRLSIDGLQSQYYVQTEKDQHIPNVMPDVVTSENIFRKEFGTSIAVRIARNKDYFRFEESLKLMVNYYVTCSPINIYYQNEKVGVDFNEILNKPLSIRKFFPFSDEQKKEISDLLRVKIDSEIGIEILPINLSISSFTHNLKGQIAFLRLKSEEIDAMEENFDFHFHIHEKGERRITFSKKYYDTQKNKEIEKEVNIPIEYIYDKAFDTAIFNRLFLRNEYGREHYQSGIKIIHNGINVPNYHERFQYQAIPKLDFYQDIFTNHFSASRYNQKHGCYGIVYLQDDLIPELSVARNMIKSFKFSIYSNIFYSTRELNQSIVKPRHYYDYIDNIEELFTLKDIVLDDLVASKVWDQEKIIRSELGISSVNELKEELKSREIKVSIQQERTFQTALVRGLIELNFSNKYVIEDQGDSYFLLKSINGSFASPSVYSEYYPLMFVEFESSEFLAHKGFINKTHWLGEWLFLKKETFAKEFEIFFNSLIRHIRERNINEVNSILKHLNRVLPEGINKDVSEKDFHVAKPPF